MAKETTQKVVITYKCRIEGEPKEPGDVVELQKGEAAYLIAHGRASANVDQAEKIKADHKKASAEAAAKKKEEKKASAQARAAAMA